MLLVRIVVLDFIDDDFKAGDEEAPTDDFSINEAIEQLVKSFQNDGTINWNRIELVFQTLYQCLNGSIVNGTKKESSLLRNLWRKIIHASNQATKGVT